MKRSTFLLMILSLLGLRIPKAADPEAFPMTDPIEPPEIDKYGIYWHEIVDLGPI